MIHYNIKKNNRSIKCVEFDGLAEQYNYIRKHVMNDVYGIQGEIQSNKGWNGDNDLNATLDGMRYGFEKQTEYFLDNISGIRAGEDMSDGTYMDYEGFAYDMGSVVQGVPECCLNFGLPTPTPCVDIMVDVSFSWNWDASILNNRGVAITNLINTLLLNKFVVNLYFMMYNHQDDMDVLALTKIDTKSLPIADIAFLSSVEFFRKICFITMDVVRGCRSCGTRGKSEMQDFILKKIKKDDMFFIGGSFSDDEMGNQCRSVEYANKYITHLFKLYCDEHKIRILFENDVDKEGNK